MLKPGDIIGERYEILELLGSGGMAYVYKAKCHKLNRFVAIKILKPEFRTDAVFLQKFQVEAQAAAALSHPNIVNVYDVGEEGDLFYIVMEFVDGITLKQYIIQKGRLYPKEAVEIALYIASGIQAAHGRHTIHRDIKPQNILVGRNGDVKVTDFGIARAASANTITSTDSAIGSVHYISPEQARGGYSDERSDIYSLGVTMYEMVTGRVPFDGENNVSVALAHIQKEAVPVCDYYEDIPVSLEKIIIKAMQKKPERRYQTIQELILDLKRVFLEPEGDYVRIAPILNDSPTIMMSEEERSKIKAGVKNEDQIEVFPVNPDNPYEKEQEVPHKRKAKNQYEERPLPMRNQDTDEEEDYEEEYEEEYEERELDDPEEKEGMDPKLERLVFILGIAAAVLVALFVIFMIGKGLNLFGTSKGQGSHGVTTTTTEAITTETTTEDTETTTEEETVAMINLVGKKFDDAQRELEQIGLSFAQPTYVSSDTYEAGYIIEQDIKSGEMVTKGTQVHVTISQGSENVTVPDFRGETKESAQSLASDYNVRVSFKSEYNDDVEAGEVFEQSISEGTKVKPGTTITLTISLGKEEVKIKVQDFKDMSKADAQELARQFGLVLKPVEQYSDYTEGLIYDQDIKAGTEVEEGTVITVYISKGKEPVVEYEGSVTLTQGANPFVEGEEGNEKGNVKVIADQDGEEQIIFSGVLSYADFPKTITFKSHSNAQAHIYMLVNGEQVVGAEWVVNME